MVHRDIKEALELLGVQIHGQDAVHTGGGDEVGDEFGRDGNAGLVLAILAGVTEERDDHRDAGGAGAAGGIDHDEELHQVLVGRRTGRLDDENVAPADVFVDLYEGLAVREGADRRVA